MLLAIDISNSHITVGGFPGSELCFLARIYADARRTKDQYAVELRDILALQEITPGEIDGIILSSVVPELSEKLQQACRRVFGIQALVLAPGVKTGLKIGIDNPAQLGGDLVASAVAAIAKYSLPCIICDLGTATAVSVIDASGTFLGGTLSAGIDLSMEALTRHTALLSQVRIQRPSKVIGRNSNASMQAGLILGTAAMLEGLALRIEDELGAPCTMVITGGRAKAVAEACRRAVILDEHLLLEGLRLIYERNCR